MTTDGCSSHPRLSYDDEIALVARLVERGDRAHALHHCTSALGLEPLRPEWRRPLADLLRDRALVDALEHDSHFASQAARAHHLHATGHLREAIHLIAAVQSAVPHLGFVTWFVAWANEASAHGLSIEIAALINVLLPATSFGVGRMRMLPAERAAAEELVPVARMAMNLSSDGGIALLASAILRRAARHDDAIAAAERAPGVVGPRDVSDFQGARAAGKARLR